MFVGEKATVTRVINETDILVFSSVVGDSNPIHIDREFAKTTVYEVPIAQGMLIGSLISGVLGTVLPGPGCIYISQELRFLKPVKANDEITVEVEINKVRKTSDGTAHIVVLDTRCINQEKTLVVDGQAVMKA